MNENLIDRLYIDPQNQSKGIGSAFINYAKRMYPGGLTLRTHEQNKRARWFYEKRGFKPVAFGLSPPPEPMPDVEYHWSTIELTYSRAEKIKKYLPTISEVHWSYAIVNGSDLNWVFLEDENNYHSLFWNESESKFFSRSA